MSRDILLVEPDYQNKFPPLGLMKISAYHKLLGDNVVFVKGCRSTHRDYLWDRIYLTTLFSFYWKKTIETILYYKKSVYSNHDFFIGGIMASIMPDEITKETGLAVYRGILDKQGIFDKNEYVIDELIPDYDILDQIDYTYPMAKNYIGQLSRGCVRKCPFCAVPKIEPVFKRTQSVLKLINSINDNFGLKENLVLMDNNVLALKDFASIISEIHEAGFSKGAKVPIFNLFDFYLNKAKNSRITSIDLLKIKQFLSDFLDRRIKQNENAKNLFIDAISFINTENISASIESLCNLAVQINGIFNKYKSKSLKKRGVDFNQGIDMRLLSDDAISMISEICISPLRIAFDDIKYKGLYIEKVTKCAMKGIHNLSNYILYNFLDTPQDFYERLKINVELNRQYGTKIYSFPMKYIPVAAKDRSTFVSKNWNKKFLRAIQIISHVTHGSVMPNPNFFYKAFGKNVKEFIEILHMPEDYIRNRFHHEEDGSTESWKNTYYSLNSSTKKNILLSLYENDIPEFILSASKHSSEFAKHYNK